MTGGRRTVSVTGEGSEWYAAHPYTVKLTIRERACGMTLGATLTTHAEVISRACSYLYNCPPI